MSDEITNEFYNEKLQDFDFTEFNPETILDEILINESIVSVELSNIRKICESVLNTVENKQNNSKNLEIVANCQKQTAMFANNEIERHALNPAIETVFMLTNLLQELYEQSANLKQNQACCSLLDSILESITEAVKIASVKCEYLDIEKIMPRESEEFDSQKHEIKQTIATDDNSKHKTIKKTLVPGLIYRSKVLRQAKVSVYRYMENEN